MLGHGCANNATEGKRFSPPSTAVTLRSLLTYSVANSKRLIVYTVCCRRDCQCFSVIRTRKSRRHSDVVGESSGRSYVTEQ